MNNNHGGWWWVVIIAIGIAAGLFLFATCG